MDIPSHVAISMRLKTKAKKIKQKMRRLVVDEDDIPEYSDLRSSIKMYMPSEGLGVEVDGDDNRTSRANCQVC